MKNFHEKYTAWATKKAGVALDEVDTAIPMDMDAFGPSDDEDDDELQEANVAEEIR